MKKTTTQRIDPEPLRVRIPTRLFFLLLLGVGAFLSPSLLDPNPAIAKPSPILEPGTETKSGNPRVILHTNFGDLEVELYADRSPISVANFLRYAREGRYDGTLFHRIHAYQVVQGGSFDKTGEPVPTFEPIQSEATNGVRNARGTLAMARGNTVHDATSGFFINVVDNHAFNHRGKKPRLYGYAVFGKIKKGMRVIDEMHAVSVRKDRLSDASPVDPVLLEKVSILPTKTQKKSSESEMKKNHRSERPR